MTVVNLHESGLKATKFKSLLEESRGDAAAEAAEEAVEEEMERQLEQGVVEGVAMIAEEEGRGEEGGKGGWKRWVFFWRR